ncbi:chymotrypsin-2-like [Aphidius gifuensis]|uniref:chymotrypsin-2-like n=1 Tax=Aphidius gifuensis TaxID=684658 RepID=UPI001CDB9D05|nr:chymotrypsin-2-like [Aphidius gifuensis]
MKIFLIIAGIIALSCAHSIPLKQGKSRIINGVNAELGEIPYQVSLQEKYDDFHFCGGSILNSKYVLTAAHCVVSKPVSLVQVVAATVNLMEPLATYNAKEIIVHSEYDVLDSWRNDIALVAIEGEFITTALLNYVQLANANQKIPAESPAIVSGWGRTSVGGSSPMHLQKAQIYIVEQEVCKKIYDGVKESIHETHICARHPNKQSGACNGDSGGPLTVDGQQVGIVSWSYSCALQTHPTVYTRVSQYRDWIRANTE